MFMEEYNRSFLLQVLYYFFFFFFKGEHLSKLLDRVRISWSPLQVAQTTRGVQLFDPKTWLAICIFIIHLRCHTACGSLQAGFDTEIFKTWSSVSSVNLPNIPRNLSFSPVLSLPFCQPLNKSSEICLCTSLSKLRVLWKKKVCLIHLCIPSA